MRVQGRDHAEHMMTDDDLIYDNENWPKTKDKDDDKGIHGKGKIKWYDRLPYDDFVDDLPKLRNIRGSKSKISLTTFDEINKVCQQIFECNKSFFRFRVQVDLLSHYIGAKILEQIWIVKKNIKKYPLSQLLEDQEKQFAVWDQMKTVKELFSSLCDKKVAGFITDEEMNELVAKYIDTFDSPDERIKMSRVIDTMLEKGEVFKAKERERKNYEYAQKQKEYGIHKVT